MSVSAGLNRVTILSCTVAVALVAVALVVDRTPPPTVARLAAQVLAPRAAPPAAPLDVVPATRALAPVEVSRRLFTSSPTAVLADAADPEAQRLAIVAATELGVPALVDVPEASVELRRLGAATVLTFGRTAAVAGARPVPLDEVQVAAEVDRVRGDAGRPAEADVDAVVLTRSAPGNAVAVATARIAGAEVLETPDADPRSDPAVARYLAEHPDQPVIALGAAFTHVGYPLDVVRRGIEQPTGGFLALGGKTYTAMYGHPGAPQLGVLGEQGVRASVERVERLATKYRRVGKRTFVPTFEIIATVASASAGKDKDYSAEASVAELQPLVDAAEKAGVYVVLDLQPGRTDSLIQAKRYRSLLERPHVGLAIDPEWRLKSKQKHLVQIGSVSAEEINRTGAWLADLTRDNALPQKIFVLHQFSLGMIKHRDRVDISRPELATVIHVDGSGPQGAKQGTWEVLRQDAPANVGWGWKNFVDEDSPMLTARQTWRQVRPHPDFISYQ
jgi:hypothetical protein